jgi:hypothetical protein
MAETGKRQRNLRKRKLEQDSEPHSAEEDDDSLRCECTALLLNAGVQHPGSVRVSVVLAGPCWKTQRCCRRPVPARRYVRASIAIRSYLLCHRTHAHNGLQGLSAETLLSSAGGEEGAEVRRMLGALNARPTMRSF